MNRTMKIMLTTGLMLFPATLWAGCSADANKRVVDALVKKALAECIAENAHLGDVELQKACGFAEDLWPIVRDLVMAQRRGLAKAASSRDAGPSDAAKE